MKLLKTMRMFVASFAILFSGTVFGFSLVQVHAQDIEVEVGNNAPTIVAGTEKICDNSTPIANTNAAINGCSNLSSITANAGGTRALSFFAKARDVNGNSDIVSSTLTGVFYHDVNSDTGTEGCTADNNDCYQLSCNKVVDIATGGGIDAWLRCDFDLEYYADDSEGLAEWLGYIEVEDASSTTGDNASAYSTEIPKLVSGTFPVVDYGDVDQGQTLDATNNIEITHQNNGNVTIDYLVNLDNDDVDSALNCDTGTLSNTNIKFDTSDENYASAGFTLTPEPTDVDMNINVQQRTDDSAPVNDNATGDIQTSYWNVSVPGAGAEGFCEEELNVTVLEGP